MKSSIVAVKGALLHYGQRENCRRPAIDTKSTESEGAGSTCMLHVGRVASCYSVYCAEYGVYYVQYNNTCYINTEI